MAEGETAEFEATATGATEGVKWEVSTNKGVSFAEDTTDAGRATDTLKVEHVTSSENENEYRAVFKNAAGSTTTLAATLTVTAGVKEPEITEQPKNKEVTEPATATFTAKASGTPTPAVKWEVSTNHGATFTEDMTDPGRTTETLMLEHTTVSESGNEYSRGVLQRPWLAEDDQRRNADRQRRNQSPGGHRTAHEPESHGTGDRHVQSDSIGQARADS